MSKDTLLLTLAEVLSHYKEVHMAVLTIISCHFLPLSSLATKKKEETFACIILEQKDKHYD
jgi:hypothetical protein